MCIFPVQRTSTIPIGTYVEEEEVVQLVFVVLHIKILSSMVLASPEFTSHTLVKKGSKIEDCM